jgi:DNA polymerase-3 subunit gamma/tau
VSVYHLKYRPQLFSDLDLDYLAEKLKKILATKEIPQSFLLSGPKGAGKTSVARIIARAVNCLDLKDGEPCGKCVNCSMVLKNSDLDVIEIDAASNRGIDDIRNLKESTYLMPSRLKRKVFIIDEVHMLTKEAFNALLKVIEEPPEHVIFVLCTTDEKKIPETILSRLVKIEFRKGTKKELMVSMERIVKGEKLEIEKEALNFLADKSDGSFRNLQKTLNEVVMEYGKKISKENVDEYLKGRFGDYSGEEVEEDLAKWDLGEILRKLETLSTKGVSFVNLRENWLIYFHKKLLEKADVELVKWVNLLISASKIEKEVSIEQLPLELAVIDYFKDKKVEMPVVKIEETTVIVEKDEIIMGDVEMGSIEEKWGVILAEIKPFNHSVEAFLRATKPRKVKGSTLVLEVFYPFHKDKLEENKNREIMEECLSKVMGKKLNVEYILAKDRKKPLEIKNDTPVEAVVEKADIYDIAKDIFG